MANLFQLQQDKTKELMTENFFLPKTSLAVFSGNFLYLYHANNKGSRTKPGGLGKKSGKSVEEEGPVFDAA